MGKMAGGALLATTVGLTVSAVMSPLSIAATSSGSLTGSVNSNPRISQCQFVKVGPTSTPTPSPSSTTPTPTATATTTTPAASNTTPAASNTSSATTSQAPSTTPATSQAAVPQSSSASSTVPASSSASSTAPATSGTADTATPSSTSATLSAFYAASSPAPALCVQLQSSQASIKQGQAAEWIVSAWVRDGTLPDATLQLTASPTSQVPVFSFGCSRDGTASCDLGAVSSGSTARQFIARIAVPATATSVTSVRLTLTGNAANIVKKPSVGVSVPVTKSATTTPSCTSSAGSTPTTGSTGTGGTSVSQIPVGTLPTVGGSGGSTSSVSPGGNAAGLFPTVSPSAEPAPGPGGQGGQGGSVRAVANTEALPIGTPVVDAQLVGCALGVAFLLAVTRLSIRRRPAAAAAAAGRAAPAAPAALADPGAPTAPAAPSAPAAPTAPAATDAATTGDAVTSDAVTGNAATMPDVAATPGAADAAGAAAKPGDEAGLTRSPCPM